MMSTNSSLRRDLLTLGAGLAIALGFLTFAFGNGASLPDFSSPYRVQAELPTAVRLAPGSRVKVAGLDVGKVTKLDERRDSALVELEIDDDFGPVPVDSRASVRLRTVVGENYIDLVPGRSKKTVESGGRLPDSDPSEYVEVDEILSVLRGPTRERARATLQALGSSLEGRGGRLNRVLEDASGTIEAATPVTRVLAEDRRQLARFVERFGDIGRAVGERGRATRDLASGLRRATEAIAQRDDALRSTLTELPPALDAVRRTSGTLQRVSQQGTPVVQRLATTVDALRPAVSRLRPAMLELRGVLNGVSRAAPPLARTLRALRGAGPATAGALNGLDRLLCQVTPFVDYVAPYDREVVAVLTNMASASNFYDATGHAARLEVLLSEDSAALHSPTISKTVTALTQTGVMSNVKVRGFDPFPKPGTIGSPTGGAGSVGMEDNKIPYPDVKAAC